MCGLKLKDNLRLHYLRFDRNSFKRYLRGRKCKFEYGTFFIIFLSADFHVVIWVRAFANTEGEEELYIRMFFFFIQGYYEGTTNRVLPDYYEVTSNRFK